MTGHPLMKEYRTILLLTQTFFASHGLTPFYRSYAVALFFSNVIRQPTQSYVRPSSILKAPHDHYLSENPRPVVTIVY